MKPENHIESLILIGFGKAYEKRFPNRIIHGKKLNEVENIQWHLNCLDELHISWSIQNNALMFINDGNDGNEQKVWECFYKQSFSDMAKAILSGKTFNEIIKEETYVVRK